MAFGQPSGSPASARQVQALLALLRAAGHADLRDARGPMGFTQRQAAGKFSRDEATAFIERLEADAGDGGAAAEPHATVPLSSAERALRDMPAGLLAAELQRRGWTVVEP